MVKKLMNVKGTIWVCLLISALLGPGTVLWAQKQETAGKGSSDISHAAKPAADDSVPDDYQVGAGDVLSVNVWKEPDASGTFVVRPDGKITLPFINDLAVQGKTPTEIQQVVTDKISPFINTPSVTVSVREIHSKKVFVLGQVTHTGAYEIGQETTILRILTEAGGLQPFAKQKSIYVLRRENGQQEKIPFNYREVVQGKKMEQDIVLEAGDVVVVP